VSDWTTDAADAIDHAVGLVRDKTVEPVQAATKALVYGLMAALIGLPALVLLVIGLFRVLVNWPWAGEVWGAWLTLGAIFLLAGGFLFARRNP
jgi:hypothetical protein